MHANNLRRFCDENGHRRAQRVDTYLSGSGRQGMAKPTNRDFVGSFNTNQCITCALIAWNLQQVIENDIVELDVKILAAVQSPPIAFLQHGTLGQRRQQETPSSSQTNNAEADQTECKVQRYFIVCYYCMHSLVYVQV